MSIELLSVVLGVLALPQAEPIRSWMRDRLASRALRWADSVWAISFLLPAFAFGFMFAAIFIRARVLGDPKLTVAEGCLLQVICIVVPVSLFYGVFGFFKWLSKAGDEALRNVLLLMGTLFGLGIALQLVAAIMG
jgi:hypothetical protein